MKLNDNVKDKWEVVNMHRRVNYAKILNSLPEDKIITKLDALTVIYSLGRQHNTSKQRLSKLERACDVLSLNKWEREEIFRLMEYDTIHSKVVQSSIEDEEDESSNVELLATA